MRNDRHDFPRTILLDHSSGLGKRSARISHVVHQDAHLVDDVADEYHAADLVGPWAFLVDECKGQVETVGEGRGALGAAGVGGDNDAVFDGEIFLDPTQDRGLGVEVVDGDVEETLDLSMKQTLLATWFAGEEETQERGFSCDVRSVEIHCDDVVTAGGGQHVCDQPCAL